MWNNEWKKGVDYPSWGDTEVYKKTIAGGYLLQGETPRDAYMRVSNAVARRLYKPELAEKFFDDPELSEEREVNELSPQELDKYLAEFIRSVRRKDGGDYEPSSLRITLYQ